MQTKEYYTLIELTGITMLGYRQLQKKIKKVKDKYRGRTDLIKKEKNKWLISPKIINEFKRIRKPIDYKLFTTIASKNNFDVNYWLFIVSLIRNILITENKKCRIKYVIEKNRKGIRHLHFMTNFNSSRKLKHLLNSIILIEGTNDMNLRIEKIYDIKGLHIYFRKSSKPKLLKKSEH